MIFFTLKYHYIFNIVMRSFTDSLKLYAATFLLKWRTGEYFSNVSNASM